LACYPPNQWQTAGSIGDADVEKKEAGFGDIHEENSVNAKGHYENNDFWADEIIIYRFIS